MSNDEGYLKLFAVTYAATYCPWDSMLLSAFVASEK